MAKKETMSAKIRKTAKVFPNMAPKAIATMLGVKPAYVHNVLWHERRKQTDYQVVTTPVQVIEPVKEQAALSVQVGGSHYKNMLIQPVEYIHANGLPFIEGCIIKYASRWREKGGIKDLEKIKHFVDLLIELEQRK